MGRTTDEFVSLGCWNILICMAYTVRVPRTIRMPQMYGARALHWEVPKTGNPEQSCLGISPPVRRVLYMIVPLGRASPWMLLGRLAGIFVWVER